MNLHEVYQMHCQYCFLRFEADTNEGALQRVLEHEKGCPKRLSTIGQILKTFQKEK